MHSLVRVLQHLAMRHAQFVEVRQGHAREATTEIVTWSAASAVSREPVSTVHIDRPRGRAATGRAKRQVEAPSPRRPSRKRRREA